MKRSELKTMNWQDVTKEQLSLHLHDIKETGIPNPIDFDTARYMNAYAYGSIGGGGIDVRCVYADEVVSVYIRYIKSNEIRKALEEKGWETTIHGKVFLSMCKGFDNVVFSIDKDNNVESMSMNISTFAENVLSKDITTYYDVENNAKGQVAQLRDKLKREFVEKLIVLSELKIENVEYAKRLNNEQLSLESIANIIDELDTLIDNNNSKKLDVEKITDMIANLNCEKTTDFMRHIGKWTDKQFVMGYTPENVGKMVDFGNSNGIDVVLSIDVLHDYYIYGYYEEDPYQVYKIIGLSDEFDEWNSFFSFDELAEEIIENEEWLNYLKSLE